jgi:hypothetical protein
MIVLHQISRLLLAFVLLTLLLPSVYEILRNALDVPLPNIGLGFLLSKLLTLNLIIVPIAIVLFLMSMPTISTAVKVWKWILGICLSLVFIPIALVFIPALLFPIQAPNVGGLALIPVVFFGFPAITIAIIGLLISEWIAKRRIAKFAAPVPAITSIPPQV